MLNAIVDFIVPGSPARSTMWPSGMPPPSLSSKPWMNVRIRSPWPIATHSIDRTAHREPNLYELVGARCREATREETDQIRLAVAVLQKLFHRPIFLRELRECGFGAAVDAPQAPREEREEARRGLVKLGLPVPTNEPAYGMPERRNEVRDEILYDLVVKRFGMGALGLGTKQMKLTER